MNEHYKKYQNLLRDRAWYYSKKYNFDYQELLAEANLIYVETLKKYNSEKGKFSTYLYSCLKNLSCYILRVRRHMKFNFKILPISKQLLEIEDKEFKRFEQVVEFYDCVYTELSEDTQKVFHHILYGHIQPDFKHLKLYFQKKFDYTYTQMKRIWKELKDFWHKHENIIHA